METKIDVTKLEFESQVFPTKADVALWDSLTPEQQRARIDYELAESEKEGFAPDVEVQAFWDSVLQTERAVSS